MMNEKMMNLKRKPRKSKKLSTFTMDAKREKMLAQIKEDGKSCTAVFVKAYKKSLRASVNAKCLECCWLDREAIRTCTATECPLWEVRPYQGNSEILVSPEQTKNIEEMSQQESEISQPKMEQNEENKVT